jgi:hypothetical protein
MACVITKKVAIAAFALLAGAAMPSDYKALAQGGRYGSGLGAGAAHTTGSDDQNGARRGTKHWIILHRPDGGAVHINADHIVFVMSAAATGADKRANSKLQLVNGFADVRESVEEIMRAVQSNASNQVSDM